MGLKLTPLKEVQKELSDKIVSDQQILSDEQKAFVKKYFTPQQGCFLTAQNFQFQTKDELKMAKSLVTSGIAEYSRFTYTIYNDLLIKELF